jgi:membrane protein
VKKTGGAIRRECITIKIAHSPFRKYHDFAKWIGEYIKALKCTKKIIDIFVEIPVTKQLFAISVEGEKLDMILKKYIRKYWEILLNAGNGFANDKVPKLSGALAYSTLFSLAPMMLLIIIIGGSVYGVDAAEGKIFEELKGFVGADVAAQIQELIRRIHFQQNSFLTTVISVVALIIGSTGTFAEIQDSLNMIWGVRPKAKKGLIKLLISRLLSFSMIIGLGFLLVVSLVANTLLLTLSSRILQLFPELPINIIDLINNGFIFLVISFLFAVIFKMLPDVKIQWRQVVPGAFLTAALFLLGKFFIGLYISNNNTASLYGAAGGIIVILMWIYFSAFILYFGAEFTRAYIEYSGVKIVPTSFAEYNDRRLLERYLKEQNGEEQQQTSEKD